MGPRICPDRGVTTVPVKVIASDASSKLERYGIPAAIGAALVLMLAADD